MGKHEVLKKFRDKETGQVHLAGSFYEGNDNKRLEDMFNRGFLKENEVKEPVKKVTTRKKSGE